MSTYYDVIVVGCGMSGMACAIRLAMFGKKVCLLEKHSIAGGLNSYYQRGKRQFDVGLHALTNFANKSQRKLPLTKLLRQLRIPYDSLELEEQNYSQILFPEETLNFSNDFTYLLDEVITKFPSQEKGFLKLVESIRNFNELELDQRQYKSSREVLQIHLNDPLLIEMILCPLLIYGSAWENDMDFSQFVIMFKAIYFEGLSRPKGGVRTIINLLLKKMEEVGVEVRFKTKVLEVLTDQKRVSGVLLANGEILKANKIISSIGLPETYSLVNDSFKCQLTVPSIGKLSFTETILVTDSKAPKYGFDATLIFYNNASKYLYQRPDTYFDSASAVICCPDNYHRENPEGEGHLRVTQMANYPLWKSLDKLQYKGMKEKVAQSAKEILLKCIPELKNDKLAFLFQDVFTPTTIEKYTGHFSGTVYGSENKMRDGRTDVDGLYICGTDQGFLGIVGAALSGISIANLHGLLN